MWREGYGKGNNMEKEYKSWLYCQTCLFSRQKTTKITILCVRMFYFVQMFMLEVFSISTAIHTLDRVKYANTPMCLQVKKHEFLFNLCCNSTLLFEWKLESHCPMLVFIYRKENSGESEEG